MTTHLLTLGMTIGIVAGSILLSACGPQMKEWTPDKKTPAVYEISARQTPPQPVYKKLRWVNLPEPLPSREPLESGAPVIKPVFHMELKNATLEEAAAALASTARYGSYCASTVADRKITINSLGTTDELANEISGKASVHVVVDHGNRQIRILAGASEAGSGEVPRFVIDDLDTADNS